MDLQQTFGEIKTKFNSKGKSKKGKGGFKAFVAKLSKGLMLPIALLPIAGLCLGIGATIVSQAGDNEALKIFGNFIKAPGDVIFGSLPIFFAVAVAISFTKDAGAAGLAAIVGWFVFNGVQAVFMQDVYSTTTHEIFANGATILHGTSFQSAWFQIADNKIVGFSSDANFGNIFNISDFTYDPKLDVVTINSDVTIHQSLNYTSQVMTGYDFLYWKNLDTSIFTTNMGIQSLSTSVFGGIIIGFTVSVLYNKFKNIELPAVIGFFSGVRFIPIVTFGASIVLSILFSMVWPAIGIALQAIGNGLSSAPGGVNSLVYGVANRMLVPFGLHHVMNTMFWFTSVGGDFDMNKTAEISGQVITQYGNSAIHPAGYKWYEIAGMSNPEVINGDINISINGMLQLVGTKATLLNGDHITLTYENIGNTIGVNSGEYMSGAFVFMMFALPAAAAAMVMAAPKGNRKMALAIIGSSALTSFLTGITEPIEFTFLFLAPWLYWGFHSIMSGIAFALANVFGAHVAFSFSGGFLDFILYGIIPDSIGGQSNCWILVLMGLAYMPIYYFVFYYSIKKWDIPTPGRGSNTKLFSKADYLANKVAGKKDNQILNIIDAYGGYDNIQDVDACITKLRINVNDASLVKETKLKELGAQGIMHPSATSVYSVFGPKADIIKNKINDLFDNIKENPKLKDSLLSLDTIADDKPVVKKDDVKKSFKKIIIKSPFTGIVRDMKDVPDATFAENMMGRGIAIEPTKKLVSAPVDGKMITVFPTGHAYGIETNDGTQLLIHIGVDTVKMESVKKAFKLKVKQDDKVKAGDPLVDINLDIIKKEAISSLSPIIVINNKDDKRDFKILVKPNQKVDIGTPIIELS